MKEEKIRVSFIFYGRVQAVGFRYRIRCMAQLYGVTGWVRNEYDGSVSAELQGLRGDIDRIVCELKDDRYIVIDDMVRRVLPIDPEERRFRVRY